MSGSELIGRVITVSDRCATGSRQDRSGPLARQLLETYRVVAPPPLVVPDDHEKITHAVREAVAAGADVVILTGGTGLGPRDVTPEAVTPLLDKQLPGIGEAIRAACRDRVPAVDLSRTIAGAAGRCLVLALPGSEGGVRDGLAVAGPLLGHAVAMLAGGDHEPAEPAGRAGSDHEPVRDGSAGRELVVRCEITTSVVDVARQEAAVRHPGAGAVVSFAGTVRDQDGGRAVKALEYEAHPSAEAGLRDVARWVADTFPEITAIAASHRIGLLYVGETALAVAVAAPHRAAAFAACGHFVDEAKRRVPIWKRQYLSDGGDEWVACR